MLVLIILQICEGSSVCVSAIAEKIIEIADKQYPAIPTLLEKKGSDEVGTFSRL